MLPEVDKDRRLHARAIVQRLKRWAAIDAFAAIQEPGLRDEYNARASVTALLAEVMEMVPGRTPHEALQLLEQVVRTQNRRPPSLTPTSYREVPPVEERPFPRATFSSEPEKSKRATKPTLPSIPSAKKTPSKRPTLYGIPTAPPPPGYGEDLTHEVDFDDEPA